MTMALKYVELGTPLTAIEVGILKKIGLNVINERLFIDERAIHADRPSVGRKSKNKGGTFERKVAVALSIWWSKGESKEMFTKTPRSGAWKFPQDIVPPQKCPFLISCKNEEAWKGVEKVLLTDKHRLAAYWEELMESYFKLGRESASLFESATKVLFNKVIPMVIFTRNHDSNYVMIRTSDFIRLEKSCGSFPIDKKLIQFSMNNFEEGSTRLLSGYALLLFADMMEWLEPKAVQDFVDL
jgi:hypothetical protein